MPIFLLLLAALILLAPISGFAKGSGHGSHSGRTAAQPVYVKGHMQDGKWVDGYWRARPGEADHGASGVALGSNSAAVIDTPAFYDVDDEGQSAPIGNREKPGTRCEFKAAMSDDEIAACRRK